MNITQESDMGIFVKFEPDTEEDIKFKKDLKYWRKYVTSEVYKKLYDSKVFDKENMKKIYDLLKDNLHNGS